jgi:hypothetical protein
MNKNAKGSQLKPFKMCMYFVYFSADNLRQKSAKKRAEAHKMMEKEEAETVASQEKADHRLKERLGKDYYDIDVGGVNYGDPEETLFWTEEVEAELNRWDEEKFKLAEVRIEGG